MGVYPHHEMYKKIEKDIQYRVDYMHVMLYTAQRYIDQLQRVECHAALECLEFRSKD